MTDEQQARDLLLRATQLPDEIASPVQHLISLGRRRRKQRSAQRTLAIAAIAVIAIATPQVIHTVGGRSSNPPVSPPLLTGPSAAQLAKYRWSELPPSPLGPRKEPLLVPAGRYIVELVGHRTMATDNHGAVFDLKTGRWHEIAAVDANVGFGQAVTAWTGRELFVTDGGTNFCSPPPPGPVCEPHAGLYDPATNQWSATLLPRAMWGLHPVASAWTGRVVVLVALNARHGRLAVGAYNPVTGRWQMITPRLPAEHRPALIQLVATADRVIMWSQWSGKTEPDGLTDSGIDVLAFTDTGPSPVAPWRDVTGKWPQGVEVGPPVFTGNSILLPPAMQWCVGLCKLDIEAHHGFFVSPVTLRRTGTIPYDPAAALGNFIWTGRAIISYSFGSGNPRPILVNHLDVYDLTAHTWRALASPGTHTTAVPVWTGSELLVVTHTGATLALHR